MYGSGEGITKSIARASVILLKEAFTENIHSPTIQRFGGKKAKMVETEHTRSALSMRCHQPILNYTYRMHKIK